MNVLLIVAVVWVCVLVLVWALLVTAKRGDEAAARAAAEHTPAVENLPGHVGLGRLAADVQRAFEAEQVAVIVADPRKDAPGTGRVAACFGTPSALGNRVALDAPTAALGLAPDVEAAGDRPVACAPLIRGGEVIGMLAVAGRDRAFTSYDHALLERFATVPPARFDRMHRVVSRRSSA